MADPAPHATHPDVVPREIAQGLARHRVTLLVGLTVVVDLLAGLLALVLERGGPHAFNGYGDALFWTSAQLLTVSSQKANPDFAATKVLDLFLEAYAIFVVAGLAAIFADYLHHKTQRSATQGEAPMLARLTPAGRQFLRNRDT